MSETGQRMLDGGKEPDTASLSVWLGSKNYRRWNHIVMKRILFSMRSMVYAVLLSVLFFAPLSESKLSVPPRPAEILWDSWGVPHIFAKGAEGLCYAFGWAQMRSHGDLILRLYGQARGRAAEYWGQEYLESDRWVQTMGVPSRAREWYAAQSPPFRKNLDAFAAGINDYVSQHADQINDEVEVVLPVSGIDVLAHSQRVIHFTFVTGQDSVLNATKQWDANGSNGWAIGPAHTTSGNAMLLANPHLPWSDIYLFYEAQLTAPEINAYGATLVGFPGLGIAFNDHLGWTHTVNTHDGQDLYQLTLVKGGYLWDGQVRPFRREERILKVKQPDGTFREEKLLVKHSIHGPVVVEKNEKAFALRVVGLDRPGMLEQWWDMAKAKDLTEFESVLKRLQLPMFNVVYADRDGHIMYLFNAQVPVRPKGDWTYWSGIVPGDTSESLWTKIHSFGNLPKVVDPPSHWLQNTNDPPWSATIPCVLKPEKFPTYMAPHFMDFRTQRSIRMLNTPGRISFDEMIRNKHSTHLELADRILDALIAAARSYGENLGRQAAEVLEKWDRNADAESRGTVLFRFWTQEMESLESKGSKLFSTPWDEKNPLSTPNGLADPKAAAAALEAAANRVLADFGALDIAWGDVMRLRYGNVDLPSNGGNGELGIFRVLWFDPAKDGRFQSSGGDSYIAAVEFSNPLRARVLLAYGNASQPGSPHVGDQLKLFVRKELRPVWRTRAEIEAHLELRETFK
jgi:acyl-homoserine-lactone acylase